MEYLAARGQGDGPLFISRNGKPLSRSSFADFFSALIGMINLDPMKYKPHGFRIRGTTRYAELGYEDAIIQRMGRWKSTAYRTYVRMASYGGILGR